VEAHVDFETRGALAPVALPAVILDALRCGELAVAQLTHRLADDADGEWPASRSFSTRFG